MKDFRVERLWGNGEVSRRGLYLASNVRGEQARAVNKTDRVFVEVYFHRGRRDGRRRVRFSLEGLNLLHENALAVAMQLRAILVRALLQVHFHFQVVIQERKGGPEQGYAIQEDEEQRNGYPGVHWREYQNGAVQII